MIRPGKKGPYGYSIGMGKARFKASELGTGRRLTASRDAPAQPPHTSANPRNQAPDDRIFSPVKQTINIITTICKLLSIPLFHLVIIVGLKFLSP